MAVLCNGIKNTADWCLVVTITDRKGHYVPFIQYYTLQVWSKPLHQ